MLSAKAQKSLSNAKAYFQDHLTVGDYYDQDKKVAGHWHGVAAQALGLRGVVNQEQFLRMCDGKHPDSGENLTLRRNESRVEDGKTVANRRVFYDFMFAPPKSVSLVALISDRKLVGVHEAAVAAAFSELEKYARTRVRKKGVNEDRSTANLAAAFFRHETSRAQDPQLHTHAIVFNATHDPVEDKWKALQVEDMYQARNLVDSVYNAELCRGAVALGYKIELRGKSFEIAGVSRSVIEKFSKRRMSIDEEARAMLVAMNGRESDLPRLRDWVAHEHRNRKIKDGTPEEMAKRWLGEMTAEEKAAFGGLKSAAISAGSGVAITSAAEAVKLAEKLVFERMSVVDKREVEHTALMKTLGAGVTLSEVREALESSDLVKEDKGSNLTSMDTLRAESAVIDFARVTKGHRHPVNSAFEVEKSGLDGEQAEAVRRICRSRDGVTLFRGAAGTGKTHTLKVVCAAVKESGKPLFVVAPQAAQARDMAREGMAAETVTRFLMKDALPVGAVVLLDEGGQVSTKQMREVMRKVEAARGRLIISGDTRQHGAVEASDALIAIEKHAGLGAAEIKTVRRQNPALARTADERKQILSYRAAVEDASAGKVAESFEKLQGIGAVSEVKEGDLIEGTAAAYLAAEADGAQVLAVTQTRAVASDVNAAIAARLENAGRITKARDLDCLVVRDMLKAEKDDSRSYQVGDEIIFNATYGKHKKGEVARVAKVAGDALVLEPRKGEVIGRRIGYKNAERWSVVDRQKLRIGEGSMLQMKGNIRSREGRQAVNGELVKVVTIRRDGALVVADDKGVHKTIEASQRLLNLGYCVTSYGSQGKTVDVVVLADAGSKLATHQKEWYVSISRARRQIAVVTEDIRSLGDRIRGDKTRRLAVDLSVRPANDATRRSRGPRPGSHVDRVLASAYQRFSQVNTFTRRLAAHTRQRTIQSVQKLWASNRH
jgi:conjugative relaxase-like TrwC/TraI family protein